MRAKLVDHLKFDHRAFKNTTDFLCDALLIKVEPLCCLFSDGFITHERPNMNLRAHEGRELDHIYRRRGQVPLEVSLSWPCMSSCLRLVGE